MDYCKIGKFILNERKALNLTQAKLAEKLFVSEKTVSKWENGNGIPETDLLPKLCQIFNVTLNELLNGERISNNNYVDKAEKKLLELQDLKEKNDKMLLFIEIVLGFVGVLLFLVMLFFSIYMIYKLSLVVIPIILIIIGLMMFLLSIYCCLYIEQKAGYYICCKCQHKYVPTFKKVFFAPHINRSRYMRCQYCNQKSWHKKVVR